MSLVGPRGYAAVGAAIASAPNQKEITDGVQAQLQKSFGGAEAVAQQYPQYASDITAGAILVFFLFPKPAHERELLARYHEEDTATASAA